MISKIKYRSEEFSYPVFEYLYPYLVKLVWRKKLKLETGNVLIISDQFIDEFQLLLNRIMTELLEEFNVEPQKKDWLEHQGRYEKITLNKSEYILNIATNGKDRTVFEIFCLFDWVKKASLSV